MGSFFSKTVPFHLPPFDYHGTIYPFPVAKPVDGDNKDGAFRNVESISELWTCPIPDKPWINTSLEILKNSAMMHPDRDSLGQRRVLEDGSLGDYDYIKFKVLYPIVVQLGRSLRIHFPWLQRQGRAGFYGKNSQSIQLFSLAIQSQDLTSVPIYDSLGPNAVQYIVSHSEMTILAVSEEKLPKLQEFLSKPSCIRGVVIVDSKRNSPVIEVFRKTIDSSIKVVLFEEIPCVPLEDPVIERDDDWLPSGESLEYILYTSGTTGEPKGVMIKHSAMLTVSSSFIHAILKNGWLVSNLDGVYSFLPLAHGYETAVELALLMVGARITYFSGSLRNLLSDLQFAKPSLFIAVPRVLQRIQQQVLDSFNQRNWLTRKIIQWCLWYQTLAVRKGYRVWLYDFLVFNKVKRIFGGRLRCLASGAAPLSGELSEFLQVCFGVPILEGYGLTETAAACSVTINNNHCVYYTVGAPLYGHEIRLQSIPELNYAVDDLPYPRGEILVRGPSMFSGYFKDPELTREVVEEDGWFHTGDVGQRNPDGSLSIIDRKKSMVKLSQGEYVAVEAVEAVFGESYWISQIFIYGNSYENTLVAVAAPNPNAILPLASSYGLSIIQQGEEGWKERMADVCLNSDVVKHVLAELNLHGRRMGLQGYELIAGLYLDGHIDSMGQIFTVENELLTPTFKLKRALCYEQYKPVIDSLYKTIHDKP